MRARISKAASKLFIVVFLVAIVLLSGALTVALYDAYSGTTSSSSSSSATLTEPSNVKVFGLVSTQGAGTHPTSMVFKSVRSLQTFVAPVSEGHFSIDLPNHDTYDVSTRWAGNYSWQAGETPRGEMAVDMSAGSTGAMSYNVVEPTPDSMVRVDGSVAWQVVTTNPVAIRFTSTSGGENFTTGLSPDKTFSIRLPNLMTYEVYIQSQNVTGYTDWYYAHQLEVRAGVNVVGITVRVGL